MKFKIGDRVRNTKATAGIPEGMTGTVAEDSDAPWVRWDNGEVLVRSEDYLEGLKENVHT